jgi:hypothetical protein
MPSSSSHCALRDGSTSIGGSPIDDATLAGVVVRDTPVPVRNPTPQPEARPATVSQMPRPRDNGPIYHITDGQRAALLRC